ncbi:MAG: RNA chaperone Hfq [Clostridiales bacterium]|nr:RNA chaperone Hfq [Clostridiales bacterium]
MQKTNNLQDLFLSQVRRARMNLTLILMNGFQMRGVITGYDSFVVVVNTDGKQQVVYKHAISTIVPERPVELREGESPAATPPRYIAR